MGLQKDYDDMPSTLDVYYDDQRKDIDYTEQSEQKRRLRRLIEEKLERKRLKEELADEFDDEFNWDEFDK